MSFSIEIQETSEYHLHFHNDKGICDDAIDYNLHDID